MPSLFDPLLIGDLWLPNRVVLAPLTRTRAGAGRVPVALNAEYYAQRANAGLIISEATSVDPMGVGYPDTPGIWSDEQVEGWRAVTRAVHAAGGRIFLQLWHVGRVSHPDHLGGQLPVAPSALAPEGHVSLLRPERSYVTPRGDAHTMGDSNRLATFGYVAEQLGRRGIAFLCTREALGPDRITPELKRRFGGVIIANEGFTGDSAQQALDEGHADAVAFGKLYISNPDLPQRLALKAPLTPFDPKTFYMAGQSDPRAGYTDYPAWKPAASA